MFRYVVIAIIFGFSPCSFSQEVKKESWVTQMEILFPVHLCQEDQYFRACFRVTEAQCSETMTKLLVSCLEQYSEQIPEMLKQPEDGTEWSGVLGTCAGSAYDIERSLDKISSAKCNDSSAWQ